jgi:hypothetical protein
MTPRPPFRLLDLLEPLALALLTIAIAKLVMLYLERT